MDSYIHAMSRRTRSQDRLLKEQETVGMQRAERREQEELAGRQKLDAARARTLRTAMTEDREQEAPMRARRTARPGKPLKRQAPGA
jgi:hypothetical protein